MILRVMVPAGVIVNEEAAKVSLEGAHGAFTLLPRHIDMVAEVVPCLLSFLTPEGEEEFLALEEGVLVKKDDEVLVSVQGAVRGRELGDLTAKLAEKAEEEGERDRATRSALARLESNILRRFLEAGERNR